MKTLIAYALVLFLIVFSSSCRKGKNMPETVYIEIDTTEMIVNVTDPDYDNFGQSSCKYVNSGTRAEVRENIYKNLRKYLAKNNCVIDSGQSRYIIKVNSVSFIEGQACESYMDSCITDIWGDPTVNYVYVSTLSHTADVSLFRKNGAYIESFSRKTSKREKLRNKRSSCGEPYVRSIVFGRGSMEKKISKMLRKDLTRRIHSEMGF